jgi:hypothetical protein
MRKHPLKTLISLKDDRRAGMSISDLMQKYSLPKTTIWHHVHNIPLTLPQKALLRSRMSSGIKRKEEGWSRARQEAEQILVNFKEESAWPVLLASLYWAEGTKNREFVFTNTDPLMVRIFLKIIRERLNVQDSNLTITVRISGSTDKNGCKRHWAGVTKIPFDKIRVDHNNLHNKGKTAHGICRITLKKGGHTLKLMHCLIQKIAATMLPVPAPVVQRIRTDPS